MRWVFILLLVLNCFYYVWGRLGVQVGDRNMPSLVDRSQVHGRIRLMRYGEGRGESGSATTESRVACLYLGGGEQKEVMKQLAQRLLSLDIQAQVEVVDRIVATDYWLYLAPLASRQASLRQLKELQARKIDSYIITQGDLENGISLGIFSSSDSAESALRRVREAGYKAVIRELPRAHRDYWVRVSPESRRLIDDALMARLVHSFPGLGYQEKNCKGVASSSLLE